MKIVLFSRPQVAHDAGELRRLFDGMEAFGFDCAVNEEFAPVVERLTGRQIAPQCRYGGRVGEQPADALMLCYGGDGTLLEGVHRLGGAPIPVLGVNAGHLGFLASVPAGGVEHLLGELRDGTLRTEARTLLDVRGSFAEQPESTLCLNEFTIQRHGAGLISVETYVDDQMVATYHGDGVIVSTPTGSTAYSLSVGGPIIVPHSKTIAITPVAPHSLNMRPIVICDDWTITLDVESRSHNFLVAIDGRSESCKETTRLTISRADYTIRSYFLQYIT